MPDELTEQPPVADEAKRAQEAQGALTEAAAEPAGGSEAAVDPLIAELRRQRDEYYDRLLRKAAEFDNYRKRVDRERREFTETAAADLLAELLPLVDDLERALEVETGPDGSDAYRKGVELMYKQLLDLLRKRGVRPIEAVGADFDPQYHQAIVHEVTDQHRDGEVMAELRRGYLLGDRLLRPAMVKVAKA